MAWSKTRVRRFVLTSAAGVASCVVVASIGPASAEQMGSSPSGSSSDDSPATTEIDGQTASLWTPEAVTSIEQDATTTIPYFVPPDELVDPDYFLWDSWPLRDVDGSVAEFGDQNWVVWISLSAKRDTEAAPFFERSVWRYWFSDDGVTWTFGGEALGDDPLGGRQWAGSAAYDPETERATFYYTPVGQITEGSLEAQPYPDKLPEGNPASGRPPVLQRLALVSADVEVSDQGVQFTNYGDHQLIGEADGTLYQTFDQFEPKNVIYGFRDPWYFRDPDTGDEYVLFVGNSPEFPSPYNGAVGVLRRTADASPDAGPDATDQWELLPPIAVAEETNTQLERPHLVWHDGLAYLFWTTHEFVFDPEGAGPEGLYGMVSTSSDWRGPYTPLNGSGLVAGNPPPQARQTYSYLVLPDLLVMSYLNTAGRPGDDDVPGDWIGSPAPLIGLEIDGATSRVVTRQTGQQEPDTEASTDSPSDGVSSEPGEGVELMRSALPEVTR